MLECSWSVSELGPAAMALTDMLYIGDIHIYVSDMTLALRFWADGLGLAVGEKEFTRHGGYARLDFADGGPSIRLIGPVEPRPSEAVSEFDQHPGVRFDITTSEFDETLTRLLEHGGRLVDEVESYNDLRVAVLADPDANVFELLEIAE